jgi:hypothetical protein
VNAQVIVVERHGDGKLYPERWWDLPAELAERLRGLEHHLRCVEHLSYRQVQRALLERFGERRSLGQIHADLHEYACCHCAPQPPKPPDPRQKPRVFAWR